MIQVNAETVCNRLGVAEFKETVLFRALQRVPALSPDGPWIAGGAVRRTMQCVSLDNDWDFFFKSTEQAEKWEDSLVTMGASLLTKNDKNSTYILPSSLPAETEGVYLPEMKIQAIKFQYYESPQAVIDSFDFTLCQFAYDGTSLIMSDFALWDVARKKLVPHRITYATSSMRRILKYVNQGYTVCAGALSEFLGQVAEDPSIIHAETRYID